MENTDFESRVLVLEEQKTLTTEASNNLESLLVYLKQLSPKQIGVEYIHPSYRLKEYAEAHPDGIICIVDKKPDLLRKIGLYKSNVISTLGKLSANIVLTIHQ
ncbi:MAG: hypothetical protein R2783_02710 [Gelidibacter sp.]